MHTKKYISAAIGLTTLAALAMALPALADTSATTGVSATVNVGGQAGGWKGGTRQGPMMKPGVFGKVTAVSGTTITIEGRSTGSMMGGTPGGTRPTTPPAAITYTVDASSATVTKGTAASTASAIAVGDTVAVEGTITGTSVVATAIHDGLMMRGPGMGMGGGPAGHMPTSTSTLIQGNGQPVVAGTVSTISGSSLTITNKSNVSYTVDATNAKVLVGNATSSIGNVKVGDTVVVQGTVNGTSVTASSVIDQSSASGTPGAPKKGPVGILGGIGQFFMHLFGF